MSRRDAYLRRTYGISLTDYEDIVRRQGGCCPVCKRAFRHIRGTPHVDHDHATGEIRGVLCGYDNQRFIGRHRDPARFESAAMYLKGPHTGFFVPVKKKKRKPRR